MIEFRSLGLYMFAYFFFLCVCVNALFVRITNVSAYDVRGQ